MLRECDIGWGNFDNDIQNTEQEGDSFDADDRSSNQCGFCDKYLPDCKELSGVEIEETQARFGKIVFHACPTDYEKCVEKYTFHNGRFCCDPYKVHTKRVSTRLKLNTLLDYRQHSGMIPGRKTCQNCAVRFAREVADNHGDTLGGVGGGGDGEGEGEGDNSDYGVETAENFDFDSQGSSTHAWSQDHKMDTVNTAFKTPHLNIESPLKKTRATSIWALLGPKRGI